MATLAETIAQSVGEAVAKAIKDAQGELTDVAKAGGDAASNGLLGDVKDVTSILSGLIGDIPVIGGLINDAANPLHAVEDGAGKFGKGFGLGYVMGYLMTELLGPLLLPLQHEVNAQTTNVLYDPATAAQLAARGWISMAQGRSESSGNGLDVPHFDQLVSMAQSWPALGETLRLLNLKLITQGEAEQFLERNGVPSDHWQSLLALRRALLSPADLALANLRGEMDDTTLQGYADQLGVTADDMQVLIANTGEPPGTMQLLEAFRRRYIDQARLARGVRQSRVRNEWLDVIEKLRYTPMSAIDAIRAYVQGHITESQARDKADQAGLLAEDFDPLYQTYGNPISVTEALSLMHRGQMTTAEVEQAIRESRFKNKYIPNILELGRRLIPIRQITTIVTHGIWTKEQGIKYLMLWGYTEADAAALVSSSTTAKTAAIKSITEGQVLELYEAKALNREQTGELLKNIGYDATEAGYIMDATEAKATLAEQKRAISAVRASFLADRITIQEAGHQLDALNVLAAQRDQLTKDWQTERKGAVRTLSPAQWASAVYYGLVKEDYALGKLEALGYSEVEARLVVDVRLHGLQKGETQASLEK